MVRSSQRLEAANFTGAVAAFFNGLLLRLRLNRRKTRYSAGSPSRSATPLLGRDFATIKTSVH